MTIANEATLEIMAITLFVFGLVFIIAGLWKMLARDLTPAAKVVAAQSARISRKALSEDIAQVVENATRLSESVNEMIRTSAGVGVLMVVIGGVFISASYMMLS